MAIHLMNMQKVNRIHDDATVYLENDIQRLKNEILHLKESVSLANANAERWREQYESLNASRNYLDDNNKDNRKELQEKRVKLSVREEEAQDLSCLLYTSPSPRDRG